VLRSVELCLVQQQAHELPHEPTIRRIAVRGDLERGDQARARCANLRPKCGGQRAIDVHSFGPMIFN
jgi:hypothetical protein